MTIRVCIRDTLSMPRLTCENAALSPLGGDKKRPPNSRRIPTAGRSAERLLLRDGLPVGSGGGIESDLGLATAAIASLHLSYGLTETIAYLGTQREALEVILYDATLRAIVEEDMQRLQRRVHTIIKRHRVAVLAIAKELRSARHPSGDTLQRLFEAHPPTRVRKRGGLYEAAYFRASIFPCSLRMRAA